MGMLHQWLFYTPLVLGKLLALGEISGSRGCAPSGSRGRAPGQGVWGESPGSWKLFVSQFFFWGTRRDQTLWPILTHDGLKCAESRKDVPFAVKIFNVVLATGRQTTIKIIKIKQQFYCYLFVTIDNSRPKYKKIDRGNIRFLGNVPPMDA